MTKLLPWGSILGALLLVGLLFQTFKDQARLPPFTRAASILVSSALVTIAWNALRPTAHATAADVLLVGATIFLILSLWFEAVPLPAVPKWLAFGASGLLLSGLAATLASAQKSESLAVTIEFTGAVFATPLLIACVARLPGMLHLLTRFWLCSAAINGFVALLDFVHLTDFTRLLTGSDFLTTVPGTSTFIINRVAGLATHPNHLGIASAISLPVALGELGRAPSWRSRALLAVIVFFLGVGILASGSRAALLGAAAGIVLMLVLAPGQRKRVVLGIAAGGCGLVIAAVAVAFMTHRGFVAVQRLLGSESVGASDSFRLENYRQGLSSFVSSPLFGHGFQLVRTAHDIYLQLLDAGGVLAFFAFLLVIAGCLRLGWNLARDHRLTPASQGVASNLLSAVFVWLLIGFVQNAIYDRYLYVPIGLLLGLSFQSQRPRWAAPFRRRDHAFGSAAVEIEGLE